MSPIHDGVQVYLYHTFHSWWTDFVGRESFRILQFFNHSFESHLCFPLMYVEGWFTNNSFDCYRSGLLLLHPEQGE